MKTTSYRTLGDGKNSIAFSIAEDRVLLPSMTDEVAVGHPLRLHELELLTQMRADQQEHAAALHPVIFQRSFRKRRTVIGAPPQEVVEICGDELVLQRVARDSLVECAH